MLSKDNVLFDREGKHLLYNSLSNSFVELSDEMSDALRNMIERNEVDPNADKDLLDMLRQIKAIDVDDEYEIRKVKFHVINGRFDKTRLSITINPTLACNFACPYCFEKDKPQVFMTDETEHAITEFVRRHNGLTHLGVTWFGGEPLLGFERIKSLTGKFLDMGIGYSAGMITNGYLITKEIAKSFEALRIYSVQITIDGMRERHDSRRYLKNGAPTFDRIIESLKLLSDHAPKTRVTVRINVDENNHADYPALKAYLSGLRLRNVFLSPGFTSDSTGTGYDCIFDKMKRHQFYVDMVRLHGYDNRPFFPVNPRTECAVRNSASCVIGPEGELYKCWNDVGNPAKVYGNLKDGVGNQKLLMDYLTAADPLENDECNECLLFPVCNGGCPYDRIQRLQQGRSENDCPIMKSGIEDYLWLHYNCLQRQTDSLYATTERSKR